MANVTLKDIAQATGFSFSLVSRVLRNKSIDNISDKTIDLIRDAASEMGYIVNKSAQSLKMNKTNIIAVVMPVGSIFSTTIFPILTESIVAAESVDDCKMDFVFFNTLGGYKEYENLQEIISLNPEGIIYSVPPKSTIGLSQDLKRQHLLNELAAKGKAIMFLMEKYDIPGTCTYSFDDTAGTYLGTKYLLDNGCRNIIFCHTSFEARDNGFKKAILELGGNCKSCVTDQMIGFSFESGYVFFNKLYDNRKAIQLPDGIFATSDSCAMGILRAMREHKLNDNDIKIMGFDCIDASNICDYSFASVAQPLRKMGTECTETLLKWIETSIMPESKIFSPKIIEYKSSSDAKFTGVNL